MRHHWWLDSFHPVTIVLCLPLHMMHLQHAHQRIAYLPVIEAADLGLLAKGDKEE